MTMPPCKGGVFLVQDRLISLPPDATRNLHSQRYVIVVSGNDPNSNADWPLVLAVPASTQTASRCSNRSASAAHATTASPSVRRKCLAGSSYSAQPEVAAVSTASSAEPEPTAPSA